MKLSRLESIRPIFHTALRAVFRAPDRRALHVPGSGAKTRLNLQVAFCRRRVVASDIALKIKLNGAKI